MVTVAEYRQATQSLVSLTQETLRDLLNRLNRSNPATARDVLLRYFPDFTAVYGDTAAVLGADLYASLRSEVITATTVQTVFAQPAKPKQSEGVVRWAVGALFLPEPNWSLFETNLLGATQRLVMQPARDTIDRMSNNDARSGRVSAVAWARRTHPERAKSGKSCDFCRMLEGRGSVYRSDEAAGMIVGRGVDPSIALDENGRRRAGYIGGVGGGVKARGSRGLANDYHDNCHCEPIPTFYEIQDRPGTRHPQVLVPIN